MARYSTGSLSPPPPQLCCFFLILLLFVGVSWRINCDAVLEDLMGQLKLVLIICPLLLLLLVHWLPPSQQPQLRIPLPAERDSIHRAGGSPWGVGFLLVFLMFMISYQSSVQERWFPMLSR